MRHRRARLTPKQRELLLHHQKLMCVGVHCKGEQYLPTTWHADHIEPLFAGGTNRFTVLPNGTLSSDSNWQALCPNCHATKSMMEFSSISEACDRPRKIARTTYQSTWRQPVEDLETVALPLRSADSSGCFTLAKCSAFTSLVRPDQKEYRRDERPTEVDPSVKGVLDPIDPAEGGCHDSNPLCCHEVGPAEECREVGPGDNKNEETLCHEADQPVKVSVKCVTERDEFKWQGTNFVDRVCDKDRKRRAHYDLEQFRCTFPSEGEKLRFPHEGEKLRFPVHGHGTPRGSFQVKQLIDGYQTRGQKRNRACDPREYIAAERSAVVLNSNSGETLSIEPSVSYLPLRSATDSMGETRPHPQESQNRFRIADPLCNTLAPINTLSSQSRTRTMPPQRLRRMSFHLPSVGSTSKQARTTVAEFLSRT